MELLDKIIDYLHYHPLSKRLDIEEFVGTAASRATICERIKETSNMSVV